MKVNPTVKFIIYAVGAYIAFQLVLAIAVVSTSSGGVTSDTGNAVAS